MSEALDKAATLSVAYLIRIGEVRAMIHLAISCLVELPICPMAPAYGLNCSLTLPGQLGIQTAYPPRAARHLVGVVWLAWPYASWCSWYW